MLSIENVTLQLPYYANWWQRRWATCLDSLSMNVARGEVHAVVGASGAGKSLLAHAVMGLLPKNAKLTGELTYQQAPLTAQRQRQLRGRELALIPQSLDALDPLVRSQRQVSWAAHRAGHARGNAWQAAGNALNHYQLDAHARHAFPHQLSGGMARRVLTAMAHVSHAQLIIADEPSVGLDPVQRDRVLNALRALAEQGKAVIIITHDLRHALRIADQVSLMRDGRGIETAPAHAFAGAGHALTSPYARALWQALPDNHFSTPERAPQESQVA
ncbi:ATP-binding cassette domain-containing protein [Halomonas sp. hl-4]|uniref:ATP-binding cassette domain-containing protein n=1 Tax=Halomonas sp. hl-4 TaxID=1761789 RepID=UPI000BB79565|nr:ATP-binding cassette domain-containing protein [Halomonas sp. hl-4]SNY96695.1 peptide/nickel transport system ATP-binding protein [Halomonas sp. hl-4]